MKLLLKLLPILLVIPSVAGLYQWYYAAKAQQESGPQVPASTLTKPSSEQYNFKQGVEASYSRPRDQQTQFLKNLFTDWAVVDPRAASGFLLNDWSREDATFKDPFLKTTALAWAAQSPVEAADYFLPLSNTQPQHTSDHDRHRAKVALEHVLSRWAGDSGKDAWDWLRRSGDELTSEVISVVVDAWSAQQPKRALAQCLLLEKGSAMRLAGLHVALETWAESDALAASQWVSANLSGFEDNTLVSAGEYIQFKISTEYGPKSALQWIRSIPGHQSRMTLLGSLAYNWIPDDPDTAIPALLACGDTADTTDTADGDDIEQMVAIVSSQALSRSPLVQQWFESQPWQKIPDSLISEYAQALQHDDAPQAYLWAKKIRDPQLRDRVCSTLLYYFQSVNPEGYDAWLKREESTPE